MIFGLFVLGVALTILAVADSIGQDRVGTEFLDKMQETDTGRKQSFLNTHLGNRTSNGL